MSSRTRTRKPSAAIRINLAPVDYRPFTVERWNRVQRSASVQEPLGSRDTRRLADAAATIRALFHFWHSVAALIAESRQPGNTKTVTSQALAQASIACGLGEPVE